MAGILDQEAEIGEFDGETKMTAQMNEIIFVVQEAPEGGFTARALGESIFTEADTLDQLRQQILDAVACHFEDGKGPGVVRLHIVKEEILAA